MLELYVKHQFCDTKTGSLHYPDMLMVLESIKLSNLDNFKIMNTELK